MKKVFKSFSLLVMVGAVLVLLVYLAFLAFDFQFISKGRFVAHRFCMSDSNLIITHVFGDVVIGISYSVITFYLVWFSVKAKLFEYRWLIVSFGSFIFACGVTHFTEVLVLWYPVYWLQASIKMVCAMFSVMTMLVLPSVVPTLLEKVNKEEVLL